MRKSIFTLFLTCLAFGQPIFADEGVHLHFKHNGFVMPGDTISKSCIQNECQRADMLHDLEKNSVRYGMLFLDNPDHTMTLLDAGCGTGGCGILIHDTFKCHVEGFTLSSKQAEFGNSLAEQYGYRGGAAFYQGDMLNLDRPDQSYDCIWACESTEQVQDLYKMFTEFGRVAKPGARMVIYALCASDLNAKKQMDAYYNTNIHTFQDYLSNAEATGWTSYLQSDLTEQTAMYWNMRASSHVATDAEKFIESKFCSRELQYYLFTFERCP